MLSSCLNLMRAPQVERDNDACTRDDELSVRHPHSSDSSEDESGSDKSHSSDFSEDEDTDQLPEETDSEEVA